MASRKRVLVRVHLIRKPGELGYKTEFIRKTYHLPVSSILACAETMRLKISPAEIYTMRSLDKRKAAAAKVVPLLSAPQPLKLSPAKGAPKAIVRFGAFNSPDPERDFLRLVLRLGTIRAKEMADNALELLQQEFGI